MTAPIDELKSEEKLSKSAEKKLHKKYQRYIQRLKEREGIDCLSEPSLNLYVANAGLGNGVQRCTVENLFTPFGQIVDIVMDATKPHAFVSYSTKEAAKSAHEKLNGRLLSYPDEVAVKGVQIFTAYVDKVPGQSIAGTSNELPPGLILLTDVVDEKYEQELLNSIEWESETNSVLSTELKHRRVKHYGYEFIYGLNNVHPDRPLEDKIPEVCERFLRDLQKLGYLKEMPDQLTVNRYQPGQGIPPHIDTHSAFTDTIVSLSLGSSVVMEFRHPEQARHLSVRLPRRSAMLMTAESRYVWTHGITPRKSDLVKDESGATTLQYRESRTSFTFRRLRRKACDCTYPKQCDSRQQAADEKAESNHVTSQDRLVLPRSDSEAIQLENKHVHQVYEDIANHFSDTRHSPWPKVAEFLNSLDDHSLVVDVGCGNGKYLGVNRTLYMIGNDRSLNLVNVCRERGYQAFVCDVTAVPLRQAVFDACICIAVIHHLSTKERRLAAIRELIHLLRPGGQCLIYVWALEQELHKVKSNYLKESKLKHKIESETRTDELPVHVNRTNFEKQDVLVPWRLKGSETEKDGEKAQIFHRFYHVFEEGELELLCSQVEDTEVVKSYYDKGNWCVILRRTDG